MTLETRALTQDDYVASLRVEQRAFGWEGEPEADLVFPAPGDLEFGTFVDGRLVARAAGQEHTSWFRGVRVPSCGIQGVAVEPEHRSGGLVAEPIRRALAVAQAPISTMFPTAPGIYRGLGYELVGSYDVVEVPTAAAALVRAPSEPVTLRRAEPADVPLVRGLYDAWAMLQHGPLDRRHARRTDEKVLDEVTAITLALAGDVPIGYCAWDRGRGYDDAAVIGVRDLFGSEPAARALWRMLGSFSSVAPRLHVRTCAASDPVRLLLPAKAWRVVESRPYGLRVDDVCAAFSTVPVSPALAPARLSFALAGDRLGDTDGAYTLALEPGSPAVCSRGDSDGPTFAPNGLARAWAGVDSCARLRVAGLLTGPTTYDDVLDRLLLGPPLEIRDYF